MWKACDELCFQSKNLYNYANYVQRQRFINDEKIIKYVDLSKLLNQHETFTELGSNSSQMTLKLLEKASLENGGEVYRNIFQGIYSQMTDYAESRIAGLLENKYDKTEIINMLEEEAFNKHKDYKLVFWQKSGRFIEISYLDKDNKLIKEKVRLLDIEGDKLKIEEEAGKQRRINYNEIIVDWSAVEYK